MTSHIIASGRWTHNHNTETCRSHVPYLKPSRVTIQSIPACVHHTISPTRYVRSPPGLVYTTTIKHKNQQSSPFFAVCASLFLAPSALRLHRRWHEDGLRRGVEVHERRPRRRSPGSAVQRYEYAQGAASVVFGGRRRCRCGVFLLASCTRGRGTAPRCTLRCLCRWGRECRRRWGFLCSVAWGGRGCFFSSVVIHAAAATAGDATAADAASFGSAALNLFDQIFCVCFVYVVVLCCSVFTIVLRSERKISGNQSVPGEE